jgi:hypothetical protein
MSCPCPSPDLSLTLLHLSDEAKKLHERHAAETCALLNQVAAQGVPRTPTDVSVDLMLAPERDAERDRLDRIKKELDDERQKFTEAAVKLGKEKTAFEVGTIDVRLSVSCLILASRVTGSSSWKRSDHGKFNKCFLRYLQPQYPIPPHPLHWLPTSLS